MKILSDADLILYNGYVITMDASRRILKDGAIAIRGGKIAAVGKSSEILAGFSGKKIDCKGGVVHPGLIDAHEHIGLHITRGWEPDTFTVYDTWMKFESLAFPKVSPAEETASVALATLEMAKNGTTAFGDTGSAFYFDAVSKVVPQVGIRGFIGQCMGDCFNEELDFLSGKTDDLLCNMEERLQKYNQGRIRAGVQLCGMGDCSDALVLGAKELARRYGQVLHMHQCVYEDEVAKYHEKYGKGPVRHLYDLDDGDIEILRDSDAKIVHCPAASLKFGLGASSAGRFPEMCAAGLGISLGTDSGTWSDALDVLHLVYLAATIHREARRKITPITSYKAFEMATLGGAAALGMQDEIGSLEVGKRADIVIHRSDIPETTPPVDPFINLIFSARSKSVDTVLVDGECIVRGGKSVLADEERILREAAATADAFQKKIGYKIYSPWPIIEK